MRSVNVVAGFARGGALAGVVAFVDDGVVEEIAAEREVEVLYGEVLQRGWFEGGEAVDCDGNGGGCCVDGRLVELPSFHRSMATWALRGCCTGLGERNRTWVPGLDDGLRGRGSCNVTRGHFGSH